MVLTSREAILETWPSVREVVEPTDSIYELDAIRVDNEDCPISPADITPTGLHYGKTLYLRTYSVALAAAATATATAVVTADGWGVATALVRAEVD